MASLVEPITEHLTHKLTTLTLFSSESATGDGDPTFDADLLAVPCFFESHMQNVKERDQNEVITVTALVFLDVIGLMADKTVQKDSKLVFDAITYEVVSAQLYYDDIGSRHHWEVLCR